MRPEAQAWWDEAGVELAAARDLLDAKRYHLCAFFCQQAVEKAMKAVWIEREKELAPKTHDLTQLGEGLGVPAPLARPLRELNPLFVTTRYPDAANGAPSQMFDDEIARKRLADAEEVMAWCRSALGLETS
jgi:HEPN domain-containing protein